MFKFSAATQILQSDDYVDSIINICQEEQLPAIGIIVDGYIVESSRLKTLVEKIGIHGFSVCLHVAPIGEPTTDTVDAAAALFRDQPPGIMIGIGGGSTLDLAKAVSVMMMVDAPVSEYHGTGKPLLKAARKIMVPTTAGTGSEVTPGAVLVNNKTLFKRALSGKLVCPDYAILDPSLTLTMPETVTITTGMDAIAHAIESYTARCANTMTKMYSAKAFQLLINNLPQVLKYPDNLVYRRRVMLGSCLAGFAIFNSNTGAAHAMAYPMGIFHSVPHGVAIANIISEVVELNVNKGCLLYSGLMDLIEGVDSGYDAEENSLRFSHYIKTYYPLEKLAVRLHDYGINEHNINHLAERALDLTSALNNNPVEFGKKDAVNVLETVLSKG